MTSIELLDETLDINSTGNYELSIEAGPDVFSFCLLDTLRNKYVLLRSFEPEENKYFSPGNIKDFISKDDFLTREFSKTRILIPSAKVTLVPSELFDPAKKESYIKINQEITDGYPILTNKPENLNIYLVFSVPPNFLEAIESFYPGITPVVHLNSLLEHIARYRKSISGNYIHLHLERDYLNLVIYIGNQLRFCNTFNYRSISDIMYFTLNVFSKLGLKHEENIYLSGFKHKNDELSTTLGEYARDIKFAVPKGNFTFSYVFGDLEIHRYLNLFNLVNCG